MGCCLFLFSFRVLCAGSTKVVAGVDSDVLVAQLDKASDYESEDWGFKSLQGYVFIVQHPHVRPPYRSVATAGVPPL